MRWRVWSDRLIVLLILLALWQVGSMILGNYWLSTPWNTVTRFFSSLLNGELFFHGGYTITEALAGCAIGGIPAVLRIDNLKTGIACGAGPWGEVNAAYRAYAKAVGFHVDACLPRCPEHKGKVENKVGFIKGRLRAAGQFDGERARLGLPVVHTQFGQGSIQRGHDGGPVDRFCLHVCHPASRAEGEVIARHAGRVGQ